MAKTRRGSGAVKDAPDALFVPREAGGAARGGVEEASYNRYSSPMAHKKVLVAAVALAVGIVAWALVNLANGWVGFAAVVPVGFRGGAEAAISLARLFAVLVLTVADGVGGRRRPGRKAIAVTVEGCPETAEGEWKLFDG
jgi:hypothetical protein